MAARAVDGAGAVSPDGLVFVQEISGFLDQGVLVPQGMSTDALSVRNTSTEDGYLHIGLTGVQVSDRALLNSISVRGFPPGGDSPPVVLADAVPCVDVLSALPLLAGETLHLSAAVALGDLTDTVGQGESAKFQLRFVMTTAATAPDASGCVDPTAPPGCRGRARGYRPGVASIRNRDRYRSSHRGKRRIRTSPTTRREQMIVAPAVPTPLGPDDNASREAGFLRLVGHGIVAGALALVMIVGALTVAVPFLTGAQAYTILTCSMEPAYSPGTLVVVRPVNPKDLQIGDAVTYQIEPGSFEVVTHRIVEVTVSSSGHRSFTTMGDNNAVADDAPVHDEQIRGQVWHALPWIGTLATLRQQHAFSMLLPAAGAGLLAWSIYLFVSWILGRVRRA